MLTLDQLTAGMALPGLERRVQQSKINLYADASGDHNPIHTDAAFAAATPLGGTIAHGMMMLAYVSEVFTAAFADAWCASGSLDARFKNPVRPGDTVTVSATVTKLEAADDGTTVVSHFTLQNQRGEAAIIGEARVRL